MNLLIASVSGQLILSGSKVTGMLNMDGLKVGSLHMDEAEFADVILVAAQVRGNLHLSRSKIGGDLECYALEVEQMILMADAKFDGRIECAWAKVKGGLMMSAQFKKDVDWGEAEIGGALGLYSAQWADGTTLVLRNAKVGIMPASLIGRLGSSTFRLSATPVSMSLTGSRFSSDSAPRPFHHGIRRRGGTIFGATLPSR